MYILIELVEGYNLVLGQFSASSHRLAAIWRQSQKSTRDLNFKGLNFANGRR